MILFAAWPSSAQNTGKISGTITDASTGEPLIGANIILEGTTYGAASDMNGAYVVIKVPSGRYNIVATSLGYQRSVVKSVQILNDLTTTINIQLVQSAIALKDEVVIIAETPMIKKDLTATEARVTSEEIQNLPVQSLEQLVTQQAGVSKDADGGIHIRGGRSTEISYLVNGISMTDDYSRSQALTVETESIQELQVISGTFNAEYGNAMSGVVNVVTKTGGSKFQSSLEAWTCDYISNRSDIFLGIKETNPTAIYNLQGTLSGPIITDKASFFLSARRSYNDGYLYGINAYSPQGRNIPGDSSYVSMNSNGRWSGQATIDWQIIGDLKFKIDIFGSRESIRYYDHLYRLDPNGIPTTTITGRSGIAKLTHQLGENTFQEITAAYKFNENKSRLYDDPYDPRYVHPDSQNVSGYHFRTAGTNLNRFERNTASFIGKWDLTSQINKHNLAKVGIEAQWDKVFYENITLVPARSANGREIFPFIPSIEGLESTNHDKFERTPIKFAGYIQDKIELEHMIINVGVRVEVFDPRGKLPADPSDPNIYSPFKLEHKYHDLNGDGQIGVDEEVTSNLLSLSEKEAFWYKKTTRKIGVSPRLGIAYPITDRGIIRFSYGVFQQVPEYSQLYLDDEYKLISAQQGVQGPFGNNDLKPQRTTIYEMGLQQQISDNFAFDVTAFYRDIRDWISSSQPIPTFLAGLAYSKRINRDFANVRGITLSVNRRHQNNFSFGIDYTFQIADGTNSSPDEEFTAQRNGSEPTKTLTPLSWDQTHTITGHMFVTYATDEAGVSIISTLNTGQPYTPTRIGGAYTGRNVLTGLAENSRRKPLIFRFDLEAFKNFNLAGINLQLFMRVLNVFDAKNPITVWGDTGEAEFTLQQKELSDYDPGWFNYPTYYSEPRSVYVGTKISL